MAFPTNLTNAVDTETEIIAAHLNNLEAKVGVDSSSVTTSIDYLLKNAASIDPGHTHSIYAKLAGSSGGQTLYGGTGSGDDLTLASTSNVTKGIIYIADIVGIKIASPTAALDINETLSGTTTSGIKVTSAGFGAISDNTSFYGLNITNSNNASAAGHTLSVGGAYISAKNDATYICDSLTGLALFTLSNHTTGSLPSMNGLYCNVSQQAAGTITTVGALNVNIISSVGTITNAYGIYTSVATASGGSIGTAYGVYISNVGATAKWGLYQADTTNNNYFAGNVGIGASSFGTNAGRVLAIASGTTPTTSPADMVQLWVEDRAGTAGKAALHIRTEDGTSHVLGDRVGFGTTSPVAFLHMSSSKTLSGISDYAYGSRLDLATYGNSTFGNIIGYDFYVMNKATAGTLNGMQSVIHSNDGTITSATGVNVAVYSRATGVVLTATGISILVGEDAGGTISGAAYGLRITGASSSGSAWSIYDDSGADCHISGDVGLATTTPTAKLDINSDILRMRTAKTPANAGATGATGNICWDTNSIYICVGTNTWKKAGIATW
jgi:hypothetical protein